MLYDSVELGIVGSPVASPRCDPHVRESFYYTLVFPMPSTREMPRINYGEICEMLRGVTAGGSARENRVIEELRAAWEAKFRSGAPMAQDMIPFSALQELMRDVIIARFSALPGMSIRSRIESLGSGRILLSFRPSSALLRTTAERLKLRVPASNALQIGADDSKEEGKLWGQAEAQEEIYRLFLAGKINAEDAQIFDYEDSGMWSRRLRALQRLSKIGIQTNEDAVYLPFRDLAALRYVYRQIDDEGDGGGDIDGSTLSPFRVVDKIRLTKAVIDSEFDCDALLERGLLEHHLCSHTHRTTDVDTSLDVLQVRWGALPNPWRVFCSFRYAGSTGDPLLHVRNYFGEQLALYFEFASFHARALRTFGLLALVLVVVAAKTSRPRETEAVFCLCSCAFLGIFVRKWELQEARLAARWSGGTPRDGDNAVNPLLQLPRPQFRGQNRRSPVTLRLEPCSPVGKEIARRLVSSLVLVALTLELGASNAVLVASNRFQSLATKTASRFNVALGVIALISKCATPHLARCSRALTDWENHRLQRDYDSQLTFKFAVLQSANSFGALWGLAFLRPLRCRFGQCRYPEHAEVDISSHDQAARMLLIMLGLDVILALWGLRWAGWRLLCGVVTGRREVLTEAATPFRMVERVQGENIGPSATLLASASSTTPIGLSIEANLVLAPYEGVLFDYAQVLVPLGFVAWFAPLAPLPSCLLAWLVAALQIRVDAYSLCYDTQRPFPIQTVSLGSWLGYLHVLRIGAILHSTVFMLMIFLDTTAADLDTKTFEQRVVVLGALFAFVGWVAYALKDHQDLTEEHRLKILRAKQMALESKYLEHLGTHLAASAKAALPSGRVFLNGVPRYVVTGDKSEEDAVEELRDQWRQQQMQMLDLEKRIAELRDSEDDTPTVGVLYAEVQGVSMLPIASPIQSFVQLCVQSGTVGIGTGNSRGDSMIIKSVKASKTTGRGAGDRALTPSPTQVANTSVSKKSRSPMWHESFELPVTALKDVLALRVCDGSPMLSTMKQRRVLGRAQLEIEDVITRTSSSTTPTVSVSIVGLPVAVDASETKPAKPISQASSASSSEDENEGEITSPRSSGTKSRSSSSRPSSRAVDVPMATYELPLELLESLRRTKQSELAKHGAPRLALRCGIRLTELGLLLAQQRRLREKLSHLRSQEVQLSSWGGV